MSDAPCLLLLPLFHVCLGTEITQFCGQNLWMIIWTQRLFFFFFFGLLRSLCWPFIVTAVREHRHIRPRCLLECRITKTITAFSSTWDKFLSFFMPEILTRCRFHPWSPSSVESLDSGQVKLLDLDTVGKIEIIPMRLHQGSTEFRKIISSRVGLWWAPREELGSWKCQPGAHRRQEHSSDLPSGVQMSLFIGRWGSSAVWNCVTALLSSSA